MAKEVIKINEQDIRKMVAETVDRSINEGLFGTAMLALKLYKKYGNLLKQVGGKMSPEQRQKIMQAIGKLGQLAQGGGNGQGLEGMLSSVTQMCDNVFSQLGIDANGGVNGILSRFGLPQGSDNDYDEQ